MSSLDSTAQSLLRDSQYLLRLHRKVVQRLIRFDPSTSARTLSPAFAQLDGRYRDRSRVQPTEPWLLRGMLRQILPAAAASERELSVLLALLPLEEYGDGSPVALLHCLRQLCPLRATMRRELLAAMPAPPDPSLSACGRALFAKRRGGVCGLDADVLLDFLTGDFGLTLSAAHFLADDCAVPGGVDAAYLYALLFTRPPPPDVRYPLLMGVLAEAAVDSRGDGPSGTRRLLHALRRLPLDPAAESAPCVDAPDLADRCLSASAFDALCAALEVGLRAEETRQLFVYLRDEARGALPVRTLLREFHRHFPPATASLFGILESAVRLYVVRAGGPLALARLFLALPDGPLRIADFLGALRAAGVPDGVADAELEWLRCAGGDRVRLVLTLCGSVPASREALVRQLFEQLREGDQSQSQGGGAVTIERVMARFHPERAGDALVGAGQEWREVMARVFAAATKDVLTYEQFAFFWCAVSAACEDDSVFTMILWRCFSMHNNRR